MFVEHHRELGQNLGGGWPLRTKGRNDDKENFPMKVATTGSVCFFHKKVGTKKRCEGFFEDSHGRND